MLFCPRRPPQLMLDCLATGNAIAVRGQLKRKPTFPTGRQTGLGKSASQDACEVRLATGYRKYCNCIDRLVYRKNCSYHSLMADQMANLLRQTIYDSGISANQLAQLSKVKQQTLSDFIRGKGISLATAQKLADHFGLELAPKKKHKKS